MRLLVVSRTGYGLGVASHLSGEGHSVDVLVGASLPTKLPTIPPDIAIFDSHADSVLAKSIRTKGVRVLGVSDWSSILASNQEYRINLIDAIGYKLWKDEPGIDVIVSCWFNGQRFISKSIVFNYDRMMAGDVGTKVDSAGYVACFDVDKSSLVRDVLTPIEKFLRKANHRGCFSISVRITDGPDILVKDISAEFTKPYTQAIYENTRTPKSDVLLSIFNESSQPLKHVEPYVCGVGLSVYPYPQSVPNALVTISGICAANTKHIWSMDIIKEDDVWVSGHLNGCIGYVTARGSSVQEAQRRAYRTISNLKADGLQYRIDIGKNVGEGLFKLRSKHLI